MQLQVRSHSGINNWLWGTQFENRKGIQVSRKCNIQVLCEQTVLDLWEGGSSAMLSPFIFPLMFTNFRCTVSVSSLSIVCTFHCLKLVRAIAVFHFSLCLLRNARHIIAKGKFVSQFMSSWYFLYLLICINSKMSQLVITIQPGRKTFS